MLSRLAREFAAEIAHHDWSDAHERADRAGHHRDHDRRPSPQLEPAQAQTVKLNAMWVTAQVLAYNDPNFDVAEFAAACGVAERRPGVLRAGLRGQGGRFQRPGSYELDPETVSS